MSIGLSLRLLKTASSSCSSEPSGNLCSGENIDNMHIDVNLAGNKVNVLGGREREK